MKKLVVVFILLLAAIVVVYADPNSDQLRSQPENAVAGVGQGVSGICQVPAIDPLLVARNHHD